MTINATATYLLLATFVAALAVLFILSITMILFPAQWGRAYLLCGGRV